MNVTTAKQNIYDRLITAPTFSPGTANLFTDWRHEPGDVLIVGHENMPVYSMGLKWNGNTTVQVSSSGDEKRPPLTKMAQQKAAGNAGSSYRNMRSSARTTQDINRTIYDESTGLITQLNVTAGKVSVVVDSDNHVKPAVIEAAITDENGYLSSYIKLSADKIYLDGSTTLNNVLAVRNNFAAFNKPVMFTDSQLAHTVTIENGVVAAEEIHVGTSIPKKTLNIYDVQISGNTLTVYYIDGTSVPFSKAITLDRALGDGYVRVRANTNAATYDVQFGGTYASTRTNLEIALNGTVTAGSIPNTIDIPIKVSALTGSQSQPQDIYTKTITAAYSGGGGAAPTISLVSAVGTNSTRTGSSSTNRIYLNADANGQTTTQYFRLISTTYTDSNGKSLYCVDLHAGTDSSGRRIGRISVQGRYDSGYESGHSVGYDSGYESGHSVGYTEGYAVTDSQIQLTAGTVGSTDDPGGTELWSSTNFVRNRWYTLKVSVHGHEKMYKVHATW